MLLLSCGSGSSPIAEVDTACSLISETGSVVIGSAIPGDPTLPEPASGYKIGKKPVLAKSYMTVSANPFASKAGCEVLKQGGSAVDAAIAVQMVLGLVEPQSSGIGGGAFMLHYNAKTGAVQSYDGRETAPAAATEDYLRYISSTNHAPPLPATGVAAFAGVRASGRAIGTPGVLRMLELAHQDNGKLAWAGLFQNAIDLANNGFKINGRLADAIALNRSALLADADASAYFLNPDQSAKALGTELKNPQYAQTLTNIAQNGAKALYSGPLAQAIVDKIKSANSNLTPGLTELSDLEAYQAKRRTAICSPYRSYMVCGMPPPSSGGLAVAQTLGILENFYLPGFGPTSIDSEGGKPSLMGVHLVSEAERLAYADRNKYVADTDFVPLPGGSAAKMLDKSYLLSRASLIRLDKSMGTASPGVFSTPQALSSSSNEGKGTSQVTIVDKDGNVVVMTTTVESSMGSFHMTRGFLLNNQLTDFSFDPTDANGVIANRIEARKRPRSSMAPTLVFRKAADGSQGEFVMGTGSPGGATIIQYVVKTLVAALDWNLNAQQATSMVDFGAANSATTNVGGEHPNIRTTPPEDALVVGLKTMGHTVNTAAQSSGIGTVIKTSRNNVPVLEGGADPRREGVALGDAFLP
jgi:gamma-glutamyltranspeptidase/glutathione hydrolase